MVQAIETVYKGYRFRSRLEARWAVFFDTVGVKYLYEPEGFDLDGIWYLPDFLLIPTRVFVEIKGSFDNFEDEKVKRLSTFFKDSYVICLTGDVWPGNFDAFIFHNGTPYVYEKATFSIGFGLFALTKLGDEKKNNHHIIGLANEGHNEDFYVPEHAYTAARQARFERR